MSVHALYADITYRFIIMRNPSKFNGAAAGFCLTSVASEHILNKPACDDPVPQEPRQALRPAAEALIIYY